MLSIHMHMHVCYKTFMRTTIDMKPEHRSALLALAANRGQKGFSRVLAEAIEEYLDSELGHAKRRKELLSLSGLLSREDANQLRKATISVRKNWR
jgi:hypothetical protein